MQFVITAYDGEGMQDKRMEVRPLHLKGMEQLKKTPRLPRRYTGRRRTPKRICSCHGVP